MIWTKDFSVKLAPSRVRASKAETMEEIIKGESLSLSMKNVARKSASSAASLEAGRPWMVDDMNSIAAFLAPT